METNCCKYLALYLAENDSIARNVISCHCVCNGLDKGQPGHSMCQLWTGR